MARRPRIVHANAWYHVMNWGRRSERIFTSDGDRRCFLALLQETREMFDVRIAAYCLMPNHYHLLVHTPGGNFSRGMQHINGVYTQRYNRRWHHDGPMFRGRFKSIVVTTDPQLLETLRYIHRNPVRAQLCRHVDGFAWSSHQGYLSSAPKWDWLYNKPLLDMFSPVITDARKHYRAFVRGDDSETSMSSRVSQDNTLKNDMFFDSKTYNTKQHVQNYCHSKTTEEIKNIVCNFFRIDQSAICQSRRGRSNLPRNIAVYLTRKHTALTLIEICDNYMISSESTVSSIVSRMELKLQKDDQLQQKVAEIKDTIKDVMHFSHK